MRTDLKVVLGIAGIALAASAGAQTIIYERSDPVVIYPANEVYQARVLSARAVEGVPQERCWTERQQVGLLELPGAIVGGPVDLFAGRQSTPYIQRCKTFAGGTAYWDVTHEFRGVERSIRMSAPPGPTIAVNGYGEPLA
jgi:hypothetical protein